jgi:choice-of-anchor A domain-containing protein
MRIRLAITTVFVAFLLFGVSAIDASPVNLGAASQFAALATTGMIITNGGGSNRISGVVGIAGIGQAFTGNATFNNTSYIHTGSVFTGNTLGPGGQVIGPGNAQADALLASAVSDANTAATNARAMTPNGGTFLTNPGTITTPSAPGTYVYNITDLSGAITITTPAGATGIMVIVNVTTSTSGSVTLNIGGSLTPEDVLWNVQSGGSLNIAGDSAGIILAPAATIVMNSRSVTGQVIAASLSMTGGNSSSIISTAPVIPETSSLSIVAIATAALLGHRFLRRRKSPG